MATYHLNCRSFLQIPLIPPTPRIPAKAGTQDKSRRR